jgi:hypothetical protein
MRKYEDSITLENMYNILKDYHEKERLYKKHYGELETYTNNINGIFEELESKFEGEKFRFNYMQPFSICDSGIKIGGSHSIAWSEKTVIVFRLHPKISSINWVDMCKEQLLTSYVLPMDDKIHEASGEARVLNKKVVTCFISHNHVYKGWNLDEEDKEDLKTNIINYVRKEYMLYNRRLIRYLEDEKRRTTFFTEMKKACKAGGDNWTAKCKDDKISDYVKRIFQDHKKKDAVTLYTEHFSENALKDAVESVLSDFLCDY